MLISPEKEEDFGNMSTGRFQMLLLLRRQQLQRASFH
jgi:hypothetical protein